LCCQAGKQLEWLTGGHVQAGMHEVIVTERTQAAAAAARAAGRSTWRVSSTLFSHIASDVVLQPLLTAAHQPAAAATKAAAGGGGSSSASLDAAAYPPTPAGQQVSGWGGAQLVQAA
jgi:isopenicillin N synthase-like dioxygenase